MGIGQLGGGLEDEVAVAVLDRHGEDGILDVLMEAGADGEGGLRSTLEDLRSPAVLVLEEGLDDLRRAVAQAQGLVRRRRGRLALGDHLVGGLERPCLLGEVELQVAHADALRRAHLHGLPVLEQQRPVAEAVHGAHVVRDEEDRRVGALDPLELLEALLLERRVADREDLVDEQDVGVHLDHHAERQADHHPARVVLELDLGELAELGEVDDLIEPAAGLARAEAEHRGVDHHVLTGRQVRVEPHPELDERRHVPGHEDAPRVGAVDAGHALQQRRLPRPVAPDDREELPAPDGEGHVAQRPQLVVLRPAQRMQRALLQRVHALARETERLGDAVDDDGRGGTRVRHGAQGYELRRAWARAWPAAR